MTKRVLIAAAMLLFAATIANAQLPPGKWWQKPEIVRELALTQDQQDKLDEIFRAAANDLIDAKGNVEKLQISLRGEMDRPTIRKQDLLRIAGQLSDARGRLFEREMMMFVDMRGVLNDQQWDRMRNALERLRERPRQMERPMDRQPGQNRMRPQPGRRP